jgi:hypothetical protein
MKKIAMNLCLLFSTSYLLAQPGIATKEAYMHAFTDLKNMLTGKDSINYERAVFITENAYYNNALDYSDFKNLLDYHTKMITLMAENARQEHAETYKTLTGYQKTMFMQNTANWAIFKYITDTTFFASNKMLYSTPYAYSAADPYGTAHWEHTQVINLLVNKTGNCYALAALFKLFSNRLQSDARLTVAPNHIYIENRNAKGDFKNVELATKTFPGDGSIQTLTYTTRELIMNGLAQRSLNDTAAVALNLIYLAKGYEKVFTNSTDEFILNCADMAFKYDTLSLNALLLKAELTENRLLEAMATNKLTTTTQARANIKTQKLLANYEKQLNNLYKLGYREIPKNIAALITAAKQGNTDGYITTNQTPNPFASIGKNQRYATLSWGLFDEMHAPQDTISYFRTSFNTKNKKVIEFVTTDTSNHYKVDPVVFACSVDPLAAKYSDLSPYNYCANNPVYYIDKEGKDIWISFEANINGKTVIQTAQYKDGKLYNKNGSPYKGGNVYITKVGEQLNKLSSVSEDADKIIKTLETSDYTHNIRYSKPSENEEEQEDLNNEVSRTVTTSNSSTIEFDNPWAKQAGEGINEMVDPAIILIHELKHAYDIDQDTYYPSYIQTNNGIRITEVNAVRIENIIRGKYDVPMRTTYDGDKIDPKLLKQKEDVTPKDVE